MGQCGIHNQQDGKGPCGETGMYPKGTNACGGMCMAGAAGCPWLPCSQARCDNVCDGTRVDGASFNIPGYPGKGKRIRCFGYHEAGATARRHIASSSRGREVSTPGIPESALP